MFTDSMGQESDTAGMTYPYSTISEARVKKLYGLGYTNRGSSVVYLHTVSASSF
jgi:hypothetical protein